MKVQLYHKGLAISIALLLILGSFQLASANPGTLEVSLPVQVTNSSYYERGQSIVYDGTNYWLFYGRSDTVTGNYDNTNPDVHDYKVYYKKATSVPDLVSATPTLISGVAHNANSYLGETGAAYFGGEVWSFATIDVGSSADLYGWYTTDGTTWSEVGPIITGLSDGQAHHDEIAFGGELWVLEGSGNFTTMHSATPKSGGWSTPLVVDSSPSVTGGLAHFFIDGSDLYIAAYSNGKNYIYKYNSSTTAWDKIDEIAPPEKYDPTLFKVGSTYVFAQAPWVSDGTTGGRQYIIGWSNTVLDGTFFDNAYKSITEGKYGTNSWVDMWPIGFTDASGDTYLFYTSERDQPSAEGTGNIWFLKFDWDTGRDHYTYIQEAVDAAVSGDTINIAAGTYDQTINLDTITNLTLNGASAATTIVKPSTTLPWNVATYGSSRQTVVRVVDSTGITLQNMTFDLDLVKGNNVFAALVWDSEGNFSNNVFQNNSVDDASGGYYELGLYVRAPNHTDTTRAAVTVDNNTFIDMGRVAIVSHDYVNITISNNTIYKTLDDFGYAIELGSQSTGSITNNTIYGFDTPALSDGSNSAGIYIENAFTWSVTTAINKNVTISNNEVYDSQWALYIGNEFDGYAGDVDINATISGNNLHNNTDGGVVIADEDKEAGSSVTANFSNNTVANNGDYGFFIYTNGDGDIGVSIQGGTITGHDIGIYMNDYASGASSSTYDVSIENAEISGNTTYGIQNEYASATIDADLNWWGNATGPGTVGPGSGDGVSANVDYSPWCGNSTCGFTVSEGPSGEFIVGSDADAAEVQSLIDAASSGDVIVLPGISFAPVGGFTISTPGVTVKLSDGTVIQGSSPCFTVAADNVTITSSTFGGGKCVPTGGSDGIVVATAVNNLVINGIEIDGSGQSTDDGIDIGANVNNLQIINNYIHDLDSDGIEYGSTSTVSGVHDVEGNLFQNNAGDGVNNLSGNTYDVELNSWGDIGGPTTGDGASGLLDYSPWTHVGLDMISSGSPVADRVGEGYQITYTIRMDANEVYGADFDLNFDNTKLSVVSITNSGVFSQQGSCSLSTPTEANSSGEISFCGTRNSALNGSDQAVFTVVFQGVDAGTVALDLDETDDSFATDSLASASNNIYASALTDGSLEVFNTTTVTGRIDLQGRPDDTGAVMSFGTGTNQGYSSSIFGDFSTSDYWGAISLSGVVWDTYPITVTMPRYLDVTVASAKTVTINSDNYVLSTLVLFGGDANDDNSIDISDLTIVGSQYGTTGSNGDINADSIVNIFDLVLTGGNYGKDSATAYASWTP